MRLRAQSNLKYSFSYHRESYMYLTKSDETWLFFKQFYNILNIKVDSRSFYHETAVFPFSYSSWMIFQWNLIWTDMSFNNMFKYWWVFKKKIDKINFITKATAAWYCCWLLFVLILQFCLCFSNIWFPRTPKQMYISDSLKHLWLSLLQK